MSPDDPDSKIALRAVVTDGRGRAVAYGPQLATWLARHAPRSARGEVGIALVSDARMRTLNRTYRRKDYATDVLSFPAEPPRRGEKVIAPPAGSPSEPSLGDLVIATGVAKRQAREAGHAFDTELQVLALHGLLHLLGYDHERDEGQMARLERRLLKKAGLAAGLIGRGTAR